MSYKYRCIHDLVILMRQILANEYLKKLSEPITKKDSDNEIFYKEAAKYGRFNKFKELKTKEDELPW